MLDKSECRPENPVVPPLGAKSFGRSAARRDSARLRGDQPAKIRAELTTRNHSFDHLKIS
jgi:hypothetical protein